ncbi:hypothetical protein LX16_1664 [Stackebrandtia albiflava]|uniref:Uncharacterized protein n=1 Tax=Stackebrandtia albiflava TaxID=406432 RepID=A0A562VDI5_9ACTN|nr:hypothetical protein [Stackebrandtia albiflava]TWJ15944.1 hypothetical protein LX16_1664 [Stackebrandtia albiflava]
MRPFRALGDALLARLIDPATATAACDPRSWTEVRCASGRRMTRGCQLSPDCVITCGAWRDSGVGC